MLSFSEYEDLVVEVSCISFPTNLLPFLVNCVITNLKGEARDFKLKLQNGQSSKKRGADTVNGIEEPTPKKQRKSAKNHVLVKDQVNRLRF